MEIAHSGVWDYVLLFNGDTQIVVKNVADGAMAFICSHKYNTKSTEDSSDIN